MNIIKKSSVEIVRGYPGYNLYCEDVNGKLVKITVEDQNENSLEKGSSNNLSNNPGNIAHPSRDYHTTSLLRRGTSQPTVGRNSVIPTFIKVKPIYLKPFYSTYTSGEAQTY